MALQQVPRMTEISATWKRHCCPPCVPRIRCWKEYAGHTFNQFTGADGAAGGVEDHAPFGEVWTNTAAGTISRVDGHGLPWRAVKKYEQNVLSKRI